MTELENKIYEITGGAVFDPLLRIGKAASAGLAQGIKRAVAEQTVKHLLRHAGVAGEHLAVSVLKKCIVPPILLTLIFHGISSLLKSKRPRQPKRLPWPLFPQQKAVGPRTAAIISTNRSPDLR